MKTPHEILGLPPHASKTEVKKAYKELAKKYHPDVNHEQGAAQRFIEIQGAYDAIMSDKVVKKQIRPSAEYRRTRRPPASNQTKKEAPKTTKAEHLNAFGAFLLIAWSVFSVLYIFPKTCITPALYGLSIGFVMLLFYLWLWLIQKKHQTYAWFFACLYGAAFVHLMLALNMLFSTPLPNETYAYTIKTEMVHEMVGRNEQGDPIEQTSVYHIHILYLEQGVYEQYPQIRLVWQNKADFYTHSHVQFQVSKGLYGINVIKKKDFVGAGIYGVAVNGCCD